MHCKFCNHNFGIKVTHKCYLSTGDFKSEISVAHTKRICFSVFSLLSEHGINKLIFRIRTRPWKNVNIKSGHDVAKSELF